MNCRKNGGTLVEAIKITIPKILSIRFELGYQCDKKERGLSNVINSKIRGLSIKSGNIRIALKDKIKEHEQEN